MRRRPPRSTLTYPLLPYTTLFRFIAHRAAGVDLAPLIVEPVADLVPDHRTDRAIVDGIVHPFAEEGRLQYAGREHDLVFEPAVIRSEEQPSELPSLMRSSYAVFCLKKKSTK